MAVTETEPTSDQALLEAQRDRLLVHLAAQRAHALHLFDWYHGRQPYPDVRSKYREDYRLLLELARTPWARLVVDTIAERLHVQGFRTSEGVAVEQQAWDLFEASALNADEWLVYTEALITGAGYLSVATGEEGATITPESVFELTHEPEPGNRRVIAAALKLYPLGWEVREWQVELYRPEATYRWQAELADTRGLDATVFPIDLADKLKPELAWEESDPFEVPNPLLAVPVVPFENRATIIGGGVSELEDCLPILRRIDKLTLDKMLTSDVAAFRQKWATGLKVPTDPETGKPIEPYKAAVDRLWVSDKEGARFGTFEASDLGQYLKAVDAEIASLAAISRVPAHYLMQQNLANPPSAESLVAAESGLVAKVRERQRRFGESWERAIRLGLALDENRVANGPALEVVWADAEMRNPAQVADAAVKLQTVGVPQRAIWEYVGATPQQLAEWTVEAAAAELAAPPVLP
jgi:Phage portal protein, SPP1 Gp6-like